MFLIALPYPTMTFMSYYAAVDRGFFESEGIDVNYVHISDGKDKIYQLFLKGNVHFLFALWEMVEIMLNGWVDIRGICGSIANPFYMFVRPEISSVGDLKGKTIMSGVKGSGSDVQARYLLHMAGLDPDKDVHFVSGDYLQRMNAFNNNQIDACQDRLQTWYWAKKAGWHRLRFEDPNLVLDCGGLSATSQMIREHPEIVMKVVKGIVGATKYIKENREKTIELAEKIIPYLNREQIAGSYDVLSEYFSPDIRPVTINFMVEALGVVAGTKKRLTFEELVDLSFLHQVYLGLE